MMHAPVKWFETSVLAISAFNLFVVALTMLWNIRRIQRASVLLLVWLFIAGVAMFMMFTIDTGLIVYTPWLFLIPSPLFYLLFPLSYLYIRMMVQDETHLSKWDLLHAVPALIHLGELAPYFLQPASYKLKVVLEVVEQPLGAFAHAEGFLSDYQHNILRGAIGFGYLVAIYRLLKQHHAEGNRAFTPFPGMWLWLRTFGFLQLIIALMLVSFLGLPWLAPPEVRATLLYVLMALSLTGTALILIFNKGLMYGMPQFAGRHTPPMAVPANEAAEGPEIDLSEIEDAEDSALEIFSKSAARQRELLDRIEAFMTTEKPYLKHRYHTTDLSNDLGIPAHHISHVLNHMLKLKYSDYVNHKRLDHMKGLVDAGDLENYTLETLALKSGFNSRITFIRAVQKLKGLNPSAYFKRPA